MGSLDRSVRDVTFSYYLSLQSKLFNLWLRAKKNEKECSSAATLAATLEA